MLLMRNIFFLLISLLISVFCISCASTYDAKIAALAPSKELRVACSPNFPPLIFKDDDRFSGFEADLAAKIGELSGVKMIFVPCSWDNIIPAVVDGKADLIMSAMTITEGRRKKLAFSSPYLKTGQICLIRDTETLRFINPEKTMEASANFAVIENTTGDKFVSDNCRNAKIFRFREIESAVSSLASGEVDVLVADAPTAWKMSLPQTITICTPLTDESIAAAVRKDNSALLIFLDAALAELDKRGELRKTEQKWIPDFLKFVK